MPAAPTKRAAAATKRAPPPASSRSAAQKSHGIHISTSVFVRPSQAIVQPLNAKATPAKTAALRETPSARANRTMPQPATTSVITPLRLETIGGANTRPRTSATGSKTVDWMATPGMPRPR